MTSVVRLLSSLLSRDSRPSGVSWQQLDSDHDDDGDHDDDSDDDENNSDDHDDDGDDDDDTNDDNNDDNNSDTHTMMIPIPLGKSSKMKR